MRSGEHLRKLIRDVPDFPRPGVLFRDITPLLRDPRGLAEACDLMAEPYRDARVDVVLGIESRGFLFGPAVAVRLGAGFAPCRKAGKLPWETVGEPYELEYGREVAEIHRDALGPGQRVLLLDDVIATGGTAVAAARLAQRSGAEVVGASFLVELRALGGRQRLDGLRVEAVLTY